ncbi:MAG: 2-oxoacid:ferredoxin oxidoreductase subunit beta [Candidatus Eremiobacteraeota bacterium]|nr:2-oxoacid:ferredoxin oxidoreductase subunit beta [Candidatus Eremiobacteraeota bacterium]
MASTLTAKDFATTTPSWWCPGCGDFGVIASLKQAAADMGLDPKNTAFISGIGCSGKISGYFHSYAFHGVHGRALPVATAVKLANKDLTVIAAGGDGDGYAIGAGHFMHAVRRNPDVTYIVMDNQTYGLTKGQSSPTSALGYVTGTSPSGNPDAPINGLAVALAAGATFIARGFSSEPKAMTELIKAAIAHSGFAIVEIMSPCVTFNKVNTYKWFKENVYHLSDVADYDAKNRAKAFDVLTQSGKIPLGIIYTEIRPTLEALTIKDAPAIASVDIESGDARYAGIQEAYR